MSLQFAPQWVKPIKPTGTVLSPTSELSSSTTSAPSSKPAPAPISASVPFPALTSSQRSASPSTTSHANPAVSYSRATHTPQSPNFPDGTQFPFDASNGTDDPKLAFRYPREAMLGLWGEDKYTNLPIDLVQMLDEGGVLVSRDVVKPVGLKERTEAEKKMLSSSVHPPTVGRRQTNPQNPNEQSANGPPHRRPVGPSSNKDPAGLANGRTAFGGFGRGEGGALGGGVSSKPGAAPGERTAGAVGGEGRIPGVLGGGFGGVNRRAGPRKSAEGAELPPADAPRSSAPWRPTRTASGNFEGVLGFGGPSQPPLSASQSTQQSGLDSSTGPAGESWKPEPLEKEKDDERFGGGGGGPGWGSAPKKWRIAAGLAPTAERSLEVAHEDPSSMSVRATPSATPLPERDAAVQDTASISTLEHESESMTRESSGHDSARSDSREEDLASVEWFYRDPNGQEQGPFIASQMHDWYSHAYFKNDLPIRRSHETSFHTLAELKDFTGNGVSPFLAPVKQRRAPPSYIPPPQHTPVSHGSQGLDSFRQLNLSSPMSDNFGQTPIPPQQNFGFPSDRNGPFSPNHFNGPASPFQSVPAPMHNQQWGAPSPFGQPNFGMPGMRPPHSQFPGTIGGAMPPRSDPFGVSSHFGGGPGGPWGAPPATSFPPAPQQSPWVQGPPSHHQQSIYDAPQHPEAQTELSFLPPQEQEESQPIGEDDEALEQSFEFVEAPDDYVDEAEEGEDQEPEEEAAAQPEPEPEAAKEPPSAWGQVRKQSVSDESISRKSSLPSAPASAQLPPTPSTATTAATAVTPSTASRLPPAPASLPPKPASARSGSISEAAPPKPAAPAEKASLPPKPAPWAVSEDTAKPATSASLREIQEAEAKRAEARRTALAEARAATSSPLATPSDEVPSNITWGLPSSASGRGLIVSTSTPSGTTPPPAAWGSGDSGPKKTLKQIQEEEERRAKKVASATAAASASLAAATSLKSLPGASPVVKRGYADLAASGAPPGSGWTTVGSNGKGPTVPGAPAARPPSSIPPKPASIPAKPATPTPAIAKPAVTTPHKAPSPDDVGPSVEFIKWTKGALVGLSGNVDDFIQMLLSFPADPPASQRADIAEIISDSVYGASSTLDGRRFAAEFMTRRKADVARASTATPGKAAKGAASLADVVKTIPKPAPAEAGFKVVKAKGKKKN